MIGHHHVIWLLFAILAFVCTLGWAALVVMANGMSDAPEEPFQGAAGIIVGLVVTVALLLAFFFA